MELLTGLLILTIILEFVGTAFLLSRMARRIRFLAVLIDVVSDLQDIEVERLDVLSETEQKLVEAQQDTTVGYDIVLSIIRILVDFAREHKHYHEGDTQPLEDTGRDCWEPNPNNFDSYDDQREWEAHLACHPDAIRCDDSAKQPADTDYPAQP